VQITNVYDHCPLRTDPDLAQESVGPWPSHEGDVSCYIDLARRFHATEAFARVAIVWQ